MPLLFDATMKEIVGMQMSDYRSFLGMPDRPSTLLNVDVSTISAATDVVIGVGEPLEEITDLNFQTGPDPKLPERGLLYNALIRFRHAVPVRTIFVLLRPKADHPNLNGSLTYKSGQTRVEFEYEVIRLWKHSAESLLDAGLGIAPLAVLGGLPENVPESEALRAIVEKIEARLLAEAATELAARLMKATYNLTRLRVPLAEMGSIFQGVGVMKAAYDELIEEGELKGELKASHKHLLLQGKRRFGLPAPETELALRSITDLDRLERMFETILTAKDWGDLLDTP